MVSVLEALPDRAGKPENQKHKRQDCCCPAEQFTRQKVADRFHIVFAKLRKLGKFEA
jgi:hypothetical protein